MKRMTSGTLSQIALGPAILKRDLWASQTSIRSLARTGENIAYEHRADAPDLPSRLPSRAGHRRRRAASNCPDLGPVSRVQRTIRNRTAGWLAFAAHAIRQSRSAARREASTA